MRRHSCAILFACSWLSACSALQPWEPIDHGPLGPVAGAGNARSKALSKCVQPVTPFGNRNCSVAFRLPSGKLIEMDELSRQVDVSLRSLARQEGWQLADDGSAVRKFQPRIHFRVLTIDPLIILAVPDRQATQIDSCRTPAFGGSCVPSSVVFNSVVWNDDAPVRDEAFWFAPGRTTGWEAVRVEQGRYVLPREIVDAELVPVNGQWQFTRR